MNRRNFLKTGALLSSAFVPLAVGAERQGSAAPTFVDIARSPDQLVGRYAMADQRAMAHAAEGWSDGRTLVRMERSATSFGPRLRITVEAAPGLTFLHLRWQGKTDERLLSRGDAWERSYGDLGWRSTCPDRPMPWYFLTTNGADAAGYGVLTGPASFSFWQRDTEGISLTIDLRNGGEAAQLSGRQIEACTIASMQCHAGEPLQVFDARFARMLCPSPRTPRQPIFGSNDWNYAYGQNTHDGILRDADLMAMLTGTSGGNRPYTVIDDGYQDVHRFPDMPGLAQAIRSRGVKPGIWIRPLQADASTPPHLLLPAARFGGRGQSLALDPTIPEALDMVRSRFRTPVGWGYEFLKHDFSTWELFGRWGFEMVPSLSAPGWAFHDRSKTNAEIVGDLYRAMRQTAGDDVVILGCNTVSHIAAGIFDSQRIGDDTSGREWERTRRYGVNSLAHRIAQHRAFYHVDPDIVAITQQVPWEDTRQWLDVVARSGTSLFVAPDPNALNEENKRAIREAFALVQMSQGGYPHQPTASLTPNAWQFAASHVTQEYNWVGKAGADLFLNT